MKNTFLGLDLGGTGAKAGVFDARGNLLGFARRGFTPDEPGPGMVEISIDIIYTSARDAAREAIKQSGIRPNAMSISSQGQTFVSLDEASNPLHPAVMWYDTRAAGIAERLNAVLQEQGFPDRFTGISSGPKIVWFREQLPDKMAIAARFLLLPDYFTFLLTGTPVTDPNTAASTGLCRVGDTAYLEEALTAAGIREEQLAVIRKTGEPCGNVLPGPAAEWGLAENALVVTGTNDQYAGAIGAGNIEPGIISAAAGTSLALVTLCRALPPMPDEGLTAGHFPVDDLKFVLAFTRNVGPLFEWFRNEFAPGSSLAELDREAAAEPAGSVPLPPIGALGADGAETDDFRALIRAKTSSGRRARVYRALLEGTAKAFRRHLECINGTGLAIRSIRAIGGAAASDVWLQIIADAAEQTIERPAVTEAAVFGAAMIAAAGADTFPSITECSRRWYRPDRKFLFRGHHT